MIPSISGMIIMMTVMGTCSGAVIDPVSQPILTVQPYTLKTSDLSRGSTLAYRPWFENGAWQGDIIEYTIQSNGTRTTDVNVGATPATDGTVNWSARAKFIANETASSTYWKDPAGRKIITSTTGTDQVAFTWDNLTSTQQNDLDSTTAVAGKTNPYDSPILNYIRCDRSNEKDKGGTLRQRYNLLGDIIHSNPVYVGAPTRSYTYNNYATFKNNNLSRSGRVYVGANDGMLHVFDAATGNEVYAYIPSMLISKLKNLTQTPYKHTYYVDGKLRADDAWSTSASAWKTILTGGLGAGGKGLFALDITNPDLSAEGSSSGTDKKVLWEIDDTDGDIGYIHGMPRVARLPDGKFYVVVGNGYDSANGIAKLLLIDVDTGNITKLTTNSGDATNKNGLSAATLVDTDGDGDADYAFAGDLNGDMWRFDLNNQTSLPKKIYDGTPTQPITGAPDVARHPYGGYMVYFGTGSLLSATDQSNKDPQAVFGIRDNPPAGANQLLIQTFTKLVHPTNNDKVRVASNNAINWATHYGWKITLPDAGERLIEQPQVRSSRLQFVSINPTVQTLPDKQDGSNWIYQLDWLTGGRTGQVVFDLNVNGSLDDGDKVDNGGMLEAPVALHLGGGNISQPTIARIRGGIDVLYINGLVLPVPQTCELNCTGGFIGGHIDVDTDSPKGGYTSENCSGDCTPQANGPTPSGGGLGQTTDGHQHEYDKVHGQTYVDYFKLEPRRGLISLKTGDGNILSKPKLNRITEVDKPTATNTETPTASTPKFPSTQKFIIVLANADLSPGGTLQIGCRTWPVKDYQNMITSQLENGVAPNNLQDTVNGITTPGTLVFTLDSIRNDTGGMCASQGVAPTLRIAFDNRAIIDGGLHPTITGCVRGDRSWQTDKGNFDASHKVKYGDTNNQGNTRPTPSQNAHITQLDSNEGSGFRWRNGALTLHVLAVNSDGSAAYTLQRAISSTDNIQLLPTKSSGGRIGGIHAQTYDAYKSGNNIVIISSKGPNESGLLYESTLFWHYGDLFKLRTGQKAPCYGKGTPNDYGSAVSIERGRLTLGEYQVLYQNIPQTVLEEYDSLVTQLQTIINSGNINETEVTTILTRLKDLIDKNKGLKKYDKHRQYAPGHIPNQQLRGIDKNSGSSSGRRPIAPADVAHDLNPVRGPNFRIGRRSWIDLR